MERFRRGLFDTITLVCLVITTWYTYLIYHEHGPAHAVDKIPDASPSMPWWVLLIGLIGICLLLTRWVPAIYRLRGAIFFQDRASLQRELGPLAERLASASTVSAIWVVGQKLYMAGAKTDSVKRLLLPDPEGEAFKHHIKTGPHESAGEMVREITRLAIKSGTKVRWYEPFIFHSIILADVDKPNGWMHSESVFPHSKSEYRPSYTLYKKHSPEAVAEMQRIFDELWERAKSPAL